MIKQCVSQFIKTHQLICTNKKVLVALSGGADSVALLRVLMALNYPCEAAHCNFRLRGEESDKDEEFVRNLCNTLNIPLHVVHFDTVEYAAEKKISIEMAARELRYNWFAEVKKECAADVIAVAHHQDDSVETILINLIRGTGINGLLGIRPRHGDVVRPLLCTSRQQIMGYLEQLNQNYVTDSTNLTDEYTRNKIRLKIIPAMEEINPSAKQSIMDTSMHLNDQALIYNTIIKEGKERVLSPEGINIRLLLKEISPKTLLFEILHPLGFNPAQVEDIFRSLIGQAGKLFISHTGIRVLKDRDYLLIDQNSRVTDSSTAPFELKMERIPNSPTFVIPREKNIACFDASKVTFPLTIRKWKQGDYFVPFGMTNKKLVSNYLTDRKFSLIDKENQWVLCSGDDIVWLIGERTDNRYKVDVESVELLVVELLPPNICFNGK